MKVRLLMLFPAILAISLAARPDTLTIIPTQPRYMEPVHVRITPATSLHIQGAQVRMSGSGIEVQYQAVTELPPSSPFDVMLGRLPTGTYSVVVNGLLGNRATTEFTVGAAPMGGSVPAVNYTDLWWNSNESGWGLGIFQGPTNLIFATWFVYDTAGHPVWYTLQPGQWIGGRQYSGPIYKSTGPWLGGPFDPSLVTENAVGTGHVFFKDSQHADFYYNVEGVSGNKQITRLPIE